MRSAGVIGAALDEIPAARIRDEGGEFRIRCWESIGVPDFGETSRVRRLRWKPRAQRHGWPSAWNVG
jgi:hypothetical protein